MRDHIVYFFSGTGNSLKVALSIQKAQGDCDVVSMGMSPVPPGNAKSIGFVLPCYFGGVPSRVLDYITHMELPKQESPYVYAVVTYGAMIGSALGQLDKALHERGITLNYAAALKSFANYVVMYDMSDKVAEKTAESKADLQPVIADILEHKTIMVKRPSLLVGVYTHMAAKDIHIRDRNFVVHTTCNSCGVCEQVCPVRNIKMDAGKPHWLGHCEQCLACLQWCPQRAIDYGGKTRKRGRYTNPEITSKMFIDHLNNKDVSATEI